MESKRALTNEEHSNATEPPLSTPVLAFTASSAGISNLPPSVLATMFDKANALVRAPKNVLPKPGATDNSYIVAGYGNTIHCVTPGKGGCMKCDRTCTHSSTGICEHVLAVAHVSGTLKEFLQWFKRSRRGPKVVEMALGSGPKNAGKKPSKRKKTNKTKPPATEVVDLLEDDTHSLPGPHLPFSAAELPPSAQQSALFPPDPSLADLRPDNYQKNAGENPKQKTTKTNPLNINALNLVQHNADSVQAHDLPSTATLPPYMQPPIFASPDAQLVGSLQHNVPSATHVLAPQTVFQTSRNWQNQNFRYNPGWNRHQSCHPLPAPQVFHSPADSFRLKWVRGTTVSRCYGCNKEIKNPPESSPDDLVVVCKDFRQYRARTTGQLQVTSEPQNVHFHLRSSCIKERYPNFPGASTLVVSADFRQHLQNEHIMRLNTEFGWLP